MPIERHGGARPTAPSEGWADRCHVLPLAEPETRAPGSRAAGRRRSVGAVADAAPHEPASWPARGLMAVGWAVLAVGALGALGRIEHFAGPIPWPALVRWSIGLALANDLVLAPIACLVGLAVGRLLPWSAKGPVAAGLFVSATVTAVAWPALRGYGRRPGDPSALPGNYAQGLAAVLVAVWAAVAVGVAMRAFSGRAGRTSAPRRSTRR